MNPRPARPGLTSAMKKRWRRTWRSRAVVTVAGVASVAGGAVVISQIPMASAKTPTVAADEATTPTSAVLGQSKQSATVPAPSGSAQSSSSTSTKKSSGSSSSSSSASSSGRLPVAPPQSTSSGS